MFAKDLASAALQSASQYASLRIALQKARKEERLAREREEERIKKEAERAAKAQAAREKKEEQKRAAEEQKMLDKKEKKEKKKRRKDESGAEEDADPDQAEAGAENGKRKKRRRAKAGAEELKASEDLPVLATQFEDHDAVVFDDFAAFLKAITRGHACVWRPRRSQMKKLLEIDGLSSRDAHSGTQALQLQLRGFISAFAEKMSDAATSGSGKSSRAVQEALQCHKGAFNLETQISSILEHMRCSGQKDPAVNPSALILERAVFDEELSKACDGARVEGAHADQHLEQAAWSELVMQGEAHGKTFSYTLPGQFPFLLYQMEGTRAVTTASIFDVACQDRK